MRIFITIFMVLFSVQLWADEVKVEVTPPRPVAGEVFQVLFRVFTQSDAEPSINFSSSGLEVVGKSNQGVSTRTVYANGQLTVTREVMVVYEMVAAKPGTSFIRDINVGVDNKSFRHNSVAITVLKEPEQAADVFVKAEVPKTEIFLGEGITARYFLYSRVPVNNLDIKKYPKLNGFLKRFLQEAEHTERVSVNGEVYLRTQIYASKLFPEKVGTLKIDSLSLSATYPESGRHDPFGAFGLNRNYKTKTMNSEIIDIQVKALPQPIPPHFTGLVGQHNFNLEFNQQKLIVNEPLEIKLTISGPGALEKLEAPPVLKHEGLEEFESTGDLKINDAASATKIFEYTFLAKQNLSIPSSKIVLSYLDPDTGRYVPHELTLPEITVAGGAANPPPKSEGPESKKNGPLKESPKKVTSLAAPIVDENFQWSQLLSKMNLALLAIAAGLACLWLVGTRPKMTLLSSHHIPSEFKKGRYNFGDLARWMSPLILKTGKSPSLIIKESELDEPAKAYFISLLETLDQREYASRKNEGQVPYNASHFKKLAAYIEKMKNEDHQQPA